MRIYLDHNATTPPAPAVVELMLRVMRDAWGNASSIHHFGQQAKAVMDEARGQVADLVGADPSEVVFTGGGTESDNAAIRGAAEALDGTGRRHLVTTAIEHEAVLNTVKALGRRGWRVTIVPVDRSGVVAADAVAEAITDETALVSVMHANNEIGTLRRWRPSPRPPMRAGRWSTPTPCRRPARSRRRPPPRRRPAVALGAQVLRPEGRRRALDPPRRAVAALRDRRQAGARAPRRHRERAGHRRPRAAAELARRDLAGAMPRLEALRDRLEAGVLAAVPGTERNGAASPRVPNTSNLSFDRVESSRCSSGWTSRAWPSRPGRRARRARSSRHTS